MTKFAAKFESAVITNKDGTPAIGTVIRKNRWGAVFYFLKVDGKCGPELYFVPQGEKTIVKRWLSA